MQPIVITGFMASGKTSVALALARLLNCRAIDLDQAISETEARTPRQIIEQDGESAFRQIETRRLRQTLELGSATVIALGGGAWTVEENRELVAAHHGLTVWIDSPFELCWQRIVAAGKERPLAPTEEQARRLFRDRRRHYELASFRLLANGEEGVAELAATIARAIEKA
jgi:shikimate kinase